MALQPTDSSLFFSRQDPEDPRLGEKVSTTLKFSENDVHLFGWPDDEGIQLNGGRPGASQAPDRIRRSLYKLTPALNARSSFAIVDRGNLITEKPLGERHNEVRALTGDVYKRGSKVISLGGGHDYGFADGSGFLDAFASDSVRPLVINFDAHLDVRPSQKGFHSGTPFRRLIEAFPKRFDFLEIGLQPQCNSQFHWDWAISQGATLWSADEIRASPILDQKILTWSKGRTKQPLWISLDIDAIQSESAPGCSQSWAWGLSVETVTMGLRSLYKLFDVKGLSIYEVSPPLDQDDRTSKLAALFCHDFLFRGLGTQS